MVSIMKKINKLLDGRQRRRVAMLVVIMVIGALLEVLGVGLIVPFVAAISDPDILDHNKYIRWFCDLLGIESHFTFILVCVIALIFVYILKNLYLMLEYSVQYRFIYRNRFAMQRKMLAMYMDRKYEFFLGTNSAKIIRTLSDSIPSAYNLLTTILSMATQTVVSAALIVAVFVISPQITSVIALSLLLAVLLIIEVVKPTLSRAGSKRWTSAALVNKWMLQAINGIKDVKVSQTEAYFQQQYNAAGDVMVETERKYAVYNTMPRMLVEMITVCSVLVIVLVMFISGTDIVTLAPMLSAFVMAALKLLPAANQITSAMSTIAYQEASLDGLLSDIEAMEKEKAEKPEGKCVSPEDAISIPQNLVELSCVTYHYPGTEKPILENASMEIPIGASVGIVGSTGAGKTTAVDILLGLLVPQKGCVLCDGKDIRRDCQGWLSHVGYIPQMMFMLDDTIRANVAFGQGNASADDEKVWAAIEKAQLGEFVRSLPEGIDTRIGERGVRISGGQRQRISIARALYTDPEILVFDEATSALDEETEEALMKSINALHGTKTMVIIAHRLTTIENCDIVYRVKDGGIVRER